MKNFKKHILRIAVLADMAREGAEKIHEDWVEEMGESDASINLAEAEKSGKKLDDAIGYRDFLWQVKNLNDQLQSLSSDEVLEAAGKFLTE